MSSTPFQFKQFTIAQDHCAAKVGTDGVLLGAWSALQENPNSILDIGTGTGVIALMLAQRSTAHTIDALELDDSAYEQATENFEASPWGDRLFCYHAHVYEFATEIEEQYDLIVSNPPFYEESSLPKASLKEDENSMSNARKKARFEDAMPFEILLGAVQNLLSEEGRFNIILPFKREKEFVQLAARGGLLPTRITRVKGTPTSQAKRSLLEFCRFDYVQECFRESKTNPTPTIQTLVIEKERHHYTSEYIALTKDFYLKM